MHQRPRTVSLHQVLSSEALTFGQGDTPDVPPVSEMQLRDSGVLSRK